MWGLDEHSISIISAVCMPWKTSLWVWHSVTVMLMLCGFRCRDVSWYHHHAPHHHHQYHHQHSQGLITALNTFRCILNTYCLMPANIWKKMQLPAELPNIAFKFCILPSVPFEVIELDLTLKLEAKFYTNLSLWVQICNYLQVVKRVLGKITNNKACIIVQTKTPAFKSKCKHTSNKTPHNCWLEP